MIIGLLQLNPTIGAFAANREKLLAAYREAVARGAEFVIAPELFLCGYPPRDLLLRDDFIEANAATLAETAESVGSAPLAVGHAGINPIRPGRPLTNAVSVLHEGKVAWQTTKCLLPTYDVFDEDRYFEPGVRPGIFEWKGIRIGITICEDIWNDEDFWPERRYRRDPVRELIQGGAQVILNLSASPWHLGKETTRLAMLQQVARDEGVPLAQVNAVGGNDELIFDGHSSALNGRGEILSLGKGFEEDTLLVDLFNGDSHCIPKPSFQPPEKLLFEALSLGLRDYVHKCGFQSVILGLSGGIDSAVVACIAAHALGPDKVTGVAMPARFSSPGSLSDASDLARNLGIHLQTIPIEPAFEMMEKTLAPAFAGRPPNEAEENLQSRLRGITLMALSNKFGSLVLTTGNKSEMAVGYCTLYGDMNGALAPIADVLKTEVYRLANWVNQRQAVIPPSSITKPPSAELRPNQMDQDSLPPYPVLDRIIQKYIVHHDKKSAIVNDEAPPEVVSDIINKISHTEYKRRQAAPALKVSPRAFGMGRQIPIAQRFKASP